MEALVMVKRDDHSTLEAYESPSLRQELKLRILLQNLLLIVCLGLFGLTTGAAALLPTAAWLLAAVLNVVTLAAALQWCHHGVRTSQIKRYLLQIDPNQNGWERWLPANRPPNLLGSRWMISTKGVFLGLGLAGVMAAAYVSPQFALGPAIASAGAWGASALLLFTNPKE